LHPGEVSTVASRGNKYCCTQGEVRNEHPGGVSTAASIGDESKIAPRESKYTCTQGEYCCTQEK